MTTIICYSKSILTKCKVLGGRSLPIVEYINIDDSYPAFPLEFRKNLESGYLSLEFTHFLKLHVHPSYRNTSCLSNEGWNGWIKLI